MASERRHLQKVMLQGRGRYRVELLLEVLQLRGRVIKRRQKQVLERSERARMVRGVT